MSFEVPTDLQYTREHEWVRRDAVGLRVGVTDYAQDQLGDALFVELPNPGSTARAGERFGEIESSKSVSDLVSPVDGTIIEINESLKNNPELVNTDPYGEGWLIVVEAPTDEATDQLLTAEEYLAHIESSSQVT